MMGQKYTLDKIMQNWKEWLILVVAFRDLDRLWKGIDSDLRIL